MTNLSWVMMANFKSSQELSSPASWATEVMKTREFKFFMSWVVTRELDTFFGWFLMTLFALKMSPTTLFLLEGLYVTKNRAGTSREKLSKHIYRKSWAINLEFILQPPKFSILNSYNLFLSQEYSWVWVGECLIPLFNSSIVRLSELG